MPTMVRPGDRGQGQGSASRVSLEHRRRPDDADNQLGRQPPPPARLRRCHGVPPAGATQVALPTQVAPLGRTGRGTVNPCGLWALGGEYRGAGGVVRRPHAARRRPESDSPVRAPHAPSSSETVACVLRAGAHPCCWGP